MSKFKVGDRVAAYMCTGRKVGLVIGNCNDEFVDVRFSSDGRLGNLHEKQLRLLKPPKPRKRVWIAIETFSNPTGYRHHKAYDYPGIQGTKEFVEVRRKK